MRPLSPLSNKEILTQAGAYVEAYFRTREPHWAVYHNLKHTKDVVEAAREIGLAVRLSEEQIEIVTLAAWFHDIGYLEDANDHEQKGVEMASRFLLENGYPPDKIGKVAGCIRATKIPQEPANLMEQVLCDADLAHLANENFLELSDLVRLELALREGREFSDLEWLEENVRFVTALSYHTSYARSKFTVRYTKNLSALQERLRKARLKQPTP